MTSLKVRVVRTDDGETLLERTLSTSEYLELLKNTELASDLSPAPDDCESGEAYDALIDSQHSS